MKMSLCNTFRFIAVSTTIVLAVVGGPVPGLIIGNEKIVNRDVSADLLQQGSLTVERKNENNRMSDINGIKLINTKHDGKSIPYDRGESKSKAHLTTTDITKDFSVSENVNKLTIDPLETTTEIISASSSKIENRGESNISVNISNTTETTKVEPTNFSQIEKDNTGPTENVMLPNHSVLSEITTDTEISNKSEKSTEPMETSSSTNGVTPTGKRYTIIERKRSNAAIDLTTSTDDSFNNEETTETTNDGEQVTGGAEVMVKSETAQGRISLQDTMTSDIPSLEKLKTDLLSYPKFTTKGETESTTILIPDESVTEMDTTTSIDTSSVSQSNPETLNTVSSKRAGYLDLSAITTDVTISDLSGLKLQGTEALQGPFDAETPDVQDETVEDKTVSREESQGQLNEDAIKEELLMERTLNENNMNVVRYRDDEQQIYTDAPLAGDADTSNVMQSNTTDVQPLITAQDDLKVKPISDKLKNTILYPVNPNYKPLKKIEVQPAKPFVRDPDDNSWRNESLSSLGIVFKPKNSSKPFTQVLKNKTETEWNNISEKDKKSEVPDLRVRLDKMAQRRKSKKKKIDSFGNVFYTDYEENSSSEENTRQQSVEDTSAGVSTTDAPTTTDVTIVTPVPTTPLLPLYTNPEIKNTSAFTTVSTPAQNIDTTLTSKQEPNKTSNKFSIFDYYESSDDDDIADYLNMAKIDLKKFTVPIQTPFTTFTSPPLPILYTTPVTHYTSERKGTIQYFPPRTTKRPRKNKYNNNVRNKINSVTLTEAPKGVLPISYHKMQPYDDGMYYTSRPDVTKLPDQEAQEPKNFDSNFYLTTPPLTTLPDESYTLIGNGEYNRPNFFIKHYKDYNNEAAEGNDKNNEFVGYTPPPQGVTTSDYVNEGAIKDHVKMDEEYDYESQFHKEVLDKFVANFNENTKRFKSDFPLLYNNSIVHSSNYHDKDAASSRAYFKRPPDARGEHRPGALHEPCEPGCDNVTVELSPAYELHYYVPDQEEKQEAEPRSVPSPPPVRYRL